MHSPVETLKVYFASTVSWWLHLEITNSHPPFLSVPNFKLLHCLCPPSLPPTAVPSNPCVVLYAPLICPWPALFTPSCCSPGSHPPIFFVSAGPSRPRAGIWLAIVDCKRANSSKQASAWKQGHGGEDKRMAKTLMPDSLRQKATVVRIAIFNILLQIFVVQKGGCLGKHHSWLDKVSPIWRSS